jgi:PiT family inorganic phosphate transporter
VLWEKVVIPMIASPILGLLIGYLVMTTILWVFRNAHPGRVQRGFRTSQTASAAAMAFGHGLQDAAKTAGVVVLVLNIAGLHEGDAIPVWVLVLSALVISAGTYAGGWRIMRTLGRKIIDLGPPQGFAAETTAASILYVAGLGFGAPISTTHTITSAIMGVGATKRLSAVRWGVAGNIIAAWFMTFPGAGLVAVAAWYATAAFR